MTKTVLVAEDDEFLIEMYQLNLEQLGIDVQLVQNGKEAIDLIDHSQPDLLVLDLLMPQIDGFGVLEHIRTKKYQFPIVVLSNLNEEADEKRCLELGVQEYFVKSDMELDDLIAKVKEYMS